MKKTIIFSLIVLGFVLIGSQKNLLSLDPPTKEMIEKYKSNGTFKSRIEQARSYGNHKISPYLIQRLKEKLLKNSNIPDGEVMAPPPEWEGMPTTGNVRVPVLLISFQDFPNVNSTSKMESKIFGKGSSSEFPLESLAEFYTRSSYGKLNITGNVLGWYKYQGLREKVQEDYTGREDLIKEALLYYDSKGHNFSQYDNDKDGDIDYLIVIWSGTHGDWASFWWAYQTSFYNRGFTVDGKSLSTYSWQWESKNYPKSEFSPSTLIHETGHALGLPDLYDYQEGIGPEGGVGGMDIMDAIWGDHNCFHKYMLGWSNPNVLSGGSADYSFSPSIENGQSLIVMPEVSDGKMFGEFFMVENRSRTGNDIEVPGDGLIIWHIDSTLTRNGRGFEYDNSNSDHKYIRLMEADGLEEIEQNADADSGDFYTEGDFFGPATKPDSISYSGENTGINIKSIYSNGDNIVFKVLMEVPVEIDLTGERAQEKAWIVISDYSDLNFSFQVNGEADLSAFIILKKYGKHDYEEYKYIGIDEVSGNSYSYKDSDIEKKAVYRYKVMAVDGSGNVLGISREVVI